MDKRVILSVAGAGKTFTICNNIEEEKRNVIIAYTVQNVKNIEKELIEKFGYIPKYTKIFTFHKFVYNFLIRSYENSISRYYNFKFKSKGLCFDEPVNATNSFGEYNYNYKLQNNIQHFVKGDKLYSSRISELVNYLCKTKCDVFTKALNQLNIFFDNIYIDEFQDFREENYKLLERIIKGFNNILLVGDYYQHSVSSINNTGLPFQKRRKNKLTGKMEKYIINYDEYCDALEKIGLKVNSTDLIKSRRCSKDVCEFVYQRLKIQIESKDINKGNVMFITNEEDAIKILNDNNITKLTYNTPYIWNFNAISWSYSKGDTYSDVLVILTDKFEKIDCDSFLLDKIPQTTINKLYVAITRTDKDLYILKSSIFNRIKDSYLKK